MLFKNLTYVVLVICVDKICAMQQRQTEWYRRLLEGGFVLILSLNQIWFKLVEERNSCCWDVLSMQELQYGGHRSQLFWGVQGT